MKEELLRRIRKLLALASNNPSKEEAASAALKAQKLMAEHGIDDIRSLSCDESDIGISWTPAKRKPWRGQLAYIIARNFRCRSAIYQGGVVFFGFQTDREIAEAVFKTLYEMGNILGNRAVGYYRVDHPRRKTTGVFDTYITGFCDGIESQLNIQSKALMLVVPEEATKYAAHLIKPGKAARAKGMSSAAKFCGSDHEVYMKGRADGRLAVSRPIEGGAR